MNYRQEIEVDLIDLCRVILKKWRSIILIMIICATGFGALSYYRPDVADKSKDMKVTVVTKDELDEMRNRLDDKKAEEVLLAVDSLLIDKEKYEDVLKQQKDSIRLRIDAEKRPVMITGYMISGYIEDTHAYMSEVTSADNIISLYSSALKSAPVIQEIRDATGYDANELYIKELYTIGKAGLSLMNITVTAPSKGECEAIMDVLEKNVASLKPSISAINQHKLEKVSENYYEQLDTGLRDEKKSLEQSIINYQKSFLTVPTTYSADQKEYYETLVDLAEGRLTLGSEEAKKAAIEKTMQEMELAAKNQTQETDYENLGITDIVSGQKNATKVLQRRVSKKVIALGVLAGAFLACMWYAAIYVISGTLRIESDLSDIFKLSIYGRIRPQKGNGKKKLFAGIDNFIERLFNKNKPAFTEEESLDIVCSGIGASARKSDAKKVFVTSADSGECSEKYRGKIVDSLKGGKYLPKGCIAETGKNVVFDPRALEKMVQSDGVVLVEKIGGSRYENIGNELETIKKYGVDVLGVVVLE